MFGYQCRIYSEIIKYTWPEFQYNEVTRFFFTGYICNHIWKSTSQLIKMITYCLVLPAVVSAFIMSIVSCSYGSVVCDCAYRIRHATTCKAKGSSLLVAIIWKSNKFLSKILYFCTILIAISYAPHILLMTVEVNESQFPKFSFQFIWHWSHSNTFKRKLFCLIPVFYNSLGPE